MTHPAVPTVHEVQQLAHDIARNGIAFYATELAELATATLQANSFPGSAAVLLDADSSDTTRARAFTVLCRNWRQIEEEAGECSGVDRSFRLLVTEWNRHHELRTSGAPVRELSASRTRLDEARGELREAERLCS